MTTENAAHAISARDLVVRPHDEPRIPDLLLAIRLGFEPPRKIRDLILRNLPELETYGDLPMIVGTPHGGANPKGGRPGKTYYLNEGQALVLCALSRTPVAAAIRREIITVFQAYRQHRSGGVDAYHDTMLVRGLLERGIDTLIGILNLIDENSDDEPDDSGGEEHDGREPDEDTEPTLGAPEVETRAVEYVDRQGFQRMVAPDFSQVGWARGSTDDLELDDCDREEDDPAEAGGDEADSDGDELDTNHSEDEGRPDCRLMSSDVLAQLEAERDATEAACKSLRILAMKLKGRGEPGSVTILRPGVAQINGKF